MVTTAVWPQFATQYLGTGKGSLFLFGGGSAMLVLSTINLVLVVILCSLLIVDS